MKLKPQGKSWYQSIQPFGNARILKSPVVPCTSFALLTSHFFRITRNKPKRSNTPPQTPPCHRSLSAGFREWVVSESRSWNPSQPFNFLPAGLRHRLLPAQSSHPQSLPLLWQHAEHHLQSSRSWQSTCSSHIGGLSKWGRCEKCDNLQSRGRLPARP